MKTAPSRAHLLWLARRNAPRPSPVHLGIAGLGAHNVRLQGPREGRATFASSGRQGASRREPKNRARCLTAPAFMTTPVAGVPNNFQQIEIKADGRDAMWGRVC